MGRPKKETIVDEVKLPDVTYNEDTKELAVGDKVIQNAEEPVLVNEISTVSIEVADGYNKDLTLYMNGKKIEFSNGKAIVKEDLVEPLKLGGYIK